MNVEEYEKMYSMEDRYWWFQGRLSIVRAILDGYMRDQPRKGRVLDVGCGTGLVLNALRAWEPVGIDFSPLALQFSQRRGAANLLRGDVTELPIVSDSMDLVLALDLMEHIEDDKRLTDEFFRVLRPGGYLMATVPAHQFLWSDHDVALHHFRRYSHEGFRHLLTNAGFDPVKYSFGISFTYFPIVAFRLLQRAWQRSHGVEAPARPRTHLIPLPHSLNRLLISILKFEGFLLRHINLPVGISLMTLCRKPE
jgi:SAM-dependent methyltransferase